MFSDVEKKILLTVFHSDQAPKQYNSVDSLNQAVDLGLSGQELIQLILGLDLRKVIAVDDEEDIHEIALTPLGIRYVEKELL